MRALAVGLVILHHAGLGFSGGYVGVDVFFVLSGYLITGVILHDVDAGRWSWRGFYERRIRRILPVSAVAILAVLALAPMVFLPSESRQIADAAMWQAAFSSNLYYWQHTGYFDLDSRMQPLLHFWSLAVEEQFYMVFPVLLVAAYRRSRRAAMWLIVAAAATSCLMSVWPVVSPYFEHGDTYYLLPSRAWELLAGAGLWFVPRCAWRAGVRDALTWAGLAGIVAASWLYTPETAFPGFAAGLPVLGTVLVIWAQGDGVTAAGRVLSWRPLRYVGRISYSLYLWHWPALVFVPLVWGPGYTWAALAITAGLSVLSYHGIEQPLRKPSGPLEQVHWRFAALACLAVVWGGMQIAPPKEDATRWVSYITSPEAVRQKDLRQIGDLGGDGPAFVLWGDSHANALVPGVDLAAQQHGVWGYVIARPGCLPMDAYQWWHGESCPEDRATIDETYRFIREHRIPTVILASRWSIFTATTPESRSLRAIGLDPHAPGDNIPVFNEAVRRSFARLHDMDVRIIAVTQPPELSFDPRTAWEVPWRFAPKTVGLDGHHRQRAAALPALRRADAVVDVDDLFTHGGSARWYRDGELLYSDDDHMSSAAARMLAPQLAAAMAGQ